MDQYFMKECLQSVISKCKRNGQKSAFIQTAYINMLGSLTALFLQVSFFL